MKTWARLSRVQLHEDVMILGQALRDPPSRFTQPADLEERLQLQHHEGRDAQRGRPEQLPDWLEPLHVARAKPDLQLRAELRRGDLHFSGL